MKQSQSMGKRVAIVAFLLATLWAIWAGVLGEAGRSLYQNTMPFLKRVFSQ